MEKKIGWRLASLALCLTALFAAAANAAGYGTLRPEDSGEEIRSMQKALDHLGHPLAADGKYGLMTQAAVRAFQKKQELAEDGIAGNATLTALYRLAPQFAPSGNAPAASPATPSAGARYEMGSSGPGVRQMQQALAALDYPCGSADGVFGRRTRDAVVSFQKRNGLEADGIAGRATLEKLYSGTALGGGSAADGNGGTDGASAYATVVTPNGKSLNFRRTAASGNNIIGTIPHGAQVGVLSRGNVWSRVGHGGKEGYVMTSFLVFAGASATQTPAPSPSPSPAPTPAPGPTSDAAFPRTLRSGDKGDDVSRLQKMLKDLKYSCNETGSFDSRTESAVRSFQTLNGLKSDGVFGPQSAGILLSGSARPADSEPLSYSTLRIDNTDGSGGAVTRLQEGLKGLDYPVAVNGKFDVKTHEAVVAFQQRNGLTISGIADAMTQSTLFGGKAKNYSTPVAELGPQEGKISGPSAGQVKLLHWYREVKPSVRGGQTCLVYEPSSGIGFTIRFYSLGSHADSEPKTFRDTRLMNRAFGAPSWDIHPVYIQLPSGTWCLAAMHNRPHLTGSITDNGFGGHLCIHFLRDLDECQRNDPNYGMSNQRAIRNKWKSMTGETVD